MPICTDGKVRSLYTHTPAEWTDPKRSALPVAPKKTLEAIGKSPGEVETLRAYMDEAAEIDAALANVS